MRWSPTFILFVTALACVIVLTENAALLAPHDQQNAQQYQSASANAQRNSETQNPPSSKESPQHQQQKAGPQWYQDPQWVTAVIVGIYTLATIVYAFFAGAQWNAMRRQSDAIISLEFARLFPRSLTLFPRDLRDRSVSLQLENHGRSPAIVQSACFEAHVGEQLERRPGYSHIQSFPSGQFIAPNHPESVLAPLHGLTELKIESIEANGPVHLWVYGWVAYRDVMGRNHEMRFIFRYAVEAGPTNFVWVADAPPQYTKST